MNENRVWIDRRRRGTHSIVTVRPSTSSLIELAISSGRGSTSLLNSSWSLGTSFLYHDFLFGFSCCPIAAMVCAAWCVRAFAAALFDRSAVGLGIRGNSTGSRQVGEGGAFTASARGSVRSTRVRDSFLQ